MLIGKFPNKLTEGNNNPWTSKAQPRREIQLFLWTIHSGIWDVFSDNALKMLKRSSAAMQFKMGTGIHRHKWNQVTSIA